MLERGDERRVPAEVSQWDAMRGESQRAAGKKRLPWPD